MMRKPGNEGSTSRLVCVTSIRILRSGVMRNYHAPFWNSGRRRDPPIDCNDTGSTCAFIISRDGVTGQILAPAWGPTRARGICWRLSKPSARPIRCHPLAGSRRPLRHAPLGVVGTLGGGGVGAEGRPGDAGQRRHASHSRAAFWSAPRHRLVFHDTPKHASWLHQLEIWCSMS
jgi:hypothetical protein